MSDNNTLDYYNLHTADFVNTTQNVDFHEIQELFFSRLKRSAEEDILSSIATERQMCDTQEQNAHLAPASADGRPSRRGSSKNEERGTELCVKD